MPDDSEELARKVVKLVQRGRLDPFLAGSTGIAETVNNRIRYLRAMEAYEQVQRVKPGDRIKIREAVRPRYLAGRRGEVIELSRKTRAGVPLILVKMDHPVGKFRDGHILLHGSSFDVIGIATSDGHGIFQLQPDDRIIG